MTAPPTLLRCVHPQPGTSSRFLHCLVAADMLIWCSAGWARCKGGAGQDGAKLQHYTGGMGLSWCMHQQPAAWICPAACSLLQTGQQPQSVHVLPAGDCTSRCSCRPPHCPGDCAGLSDRAGLPAGPDLLHRCELPPLLLLCTCGCSFLELPAAHSAGLQLRPEP